MKKRELHLRSEPARQRQRELARLSVSKLVGVPGGIKLRRDIREDYPGNGRRGTLLEIWMRGVACVTWDGCDGMYDIETKHLMPADCEKQAT